jgi:hypothetical protein
MIFLSPFISESFLSAGDHAIVSAHDTADGIGTKGAADALLFAASILRSMPWQPPQSVPIPHSCKSLTVSAPASMARRTSRSFFARQRQTIISIHPSG